ncbi:hypothetical protein D3C72_1441500 [compost metagenome]
MAQQLLQIFHQRLQRDGLRVQRLFSGKRQQPLGKLCAAFGGLQRPNNALFGLCVLRLLSGQFQAADNHRQQVVEIMRQAAGELADRLHFLAVQQRFFQRFALGAFQHHVNHATVRYRTEA